MHLRFRFQLLFVALLSGCITTGTYHYGTGDAAVGDGGSTDLAGADLTGIVPADLSSVSSPDLAIVSSPDLAMAASPDLAMSDPCHDGQRSGLETDIDCGGSQCARCSNGRSCTIDADCVSLICTFGVCSTTRSRVFSLGSPTTIPLLAGPAWPVAADFDGDGNVDLAVTNQSGQSVTFLRSNGTGTFQTISSPTGFYGYGLAYGDFDFDGRLDLVLNDNVNSRVQVMRNLGTGSFGKSFGCATAASPVEITAGDFNGDGRADFANTGGTYPNGYVAVESNTGSSCTNGTALAVGQLATDVTSGDLNGDGRPDIAATDFGLEQVAVFLNRGGGSFSTAAIYPVSSNPEGLTLGDMNGDGRLDIVVAVRNANSVGVLLNQGNGTFQAAINTYSGTLGPEDVAIADLDLDGKLDVVTANSSANNISVLLGNGTGQFKSPMYYSVGTGPSNVAIADFNRDGLPDLAVSNFAGNSMSILLNTTK